MTSKSLSNTFSLPGVEEPVTMDEHGNVFREKNGNRERMFFRDASGNWRIIVSYPVISDDTRKVLDRQLRLSR